MDRFTRSRKVDITGAGTHTLDYTIPDGKELVITELAVSGTQPIIVELLYSDDGGTT